MLVTPARPHSGVFSILTSNPSVLWVPSKLPPRRAGAPRLVEAILTSSTSREGGGLELLLEVR
jgi:hypothetical protein